jgi:DNA adenine methylase
LKTLFDEDETTALPRRNSLQLVPPLKWHGGKSYLAEWIIKLMPPHLTFVEPYAGGLAVLLAKDPDGINEIVNDISRDLTSFFRVLQKGEDFQRFRRIVEAVPFSEPEWNDAREALQAQPEADPVQRAAWFFIFCRQSLAGRMKGFATLSTTRTRRRMNEQTSAWLSAIEGLPAVHERLMRVAVLCRPALEVIRQHDGPGTLFYCDPPYPVETRTAPKVYRHEMTLADHQELLALLRQVKGKAMVSTYPSSLYEQALTGWTRHTKMIDNHASGAKTKVRETEVLWCNF